MPAGKLPPLLPPSWKIRDTSAGWVLRVQQSVKQGPLFKVQPVEPLSLSAALNCTWCGVHPLGFFLCGCECVGGPSENVDGCVVGIVSARLQSSPPQITGDCFLWRRMEGTQRQEDALLADFVCILSDYTQLCTRFMSWRTAADL